LALEQREISYSWERRRLAGELMSCFFFETRRRDASAPRPAEIRDTAYNSVAKAKCRKQIRIMTPCNRLELERFFAGIGVRMEQTDTNFAQDSSSSLVCVSEVGKFFSDIKYKVEPQQRRHDRQWATSFNVFDFIEPDENKLSDVLAWLLAPRESHGQGDLFLRLLFRQLSFGAGTKFTMDAIVQREAPTFGIKKYRRRMDVLVEAGEWLVIENKVDSPEQPEQVKDYLEHLHRCSRNRPVQSTLIYLTPDGRLPKSLRPAALKKCEESGRLHCWSYQVELRSWLED
jgi:hypothetical protein